MAHRYARGSGQEEVGVAYKRAYELSKSTGATDRAFRALFGLAHYNWTRGTLAESIRGCEELVLLAEASGDRMERISAYALSGVARWHSGDNVGALSCLDEAHEAFGPEFDSISIHGLELNDLMAYSLCLQGLSFVHLSLGNADQARSSARRSVTKFRGSPSVVSQPAMLSAVMIFCGDRATAHEWAEYAANHAEEQRIPHWMAYAQASRGRLMVDDEAGEASIAIIEDAIAQWQKTGWGSFLPMFRAHLIDAYLAKKRPSEALEVADQALESMTKNGEKQFESLLLVCQGDAYVTSAEPRKAESCYARAIDVAHTQSAKFWELRAATRLARLWQSQGRVTEARDLLAPIYGWFTEGFDTADLKDAKALLDTLA